MAEVMSAGVEIRVNGLRYGYWQSVEIRDSVDDLCTSVQLAITLPAGGTSKDLMLDANSVLEVLVDGVVATTVRVDVFTEELDKENHGITLEARSLGRELVDTQYSKVMNGLRLAEIVKALCTQFKVPVKIVGETFLVPNFAMQCESPANALINAARAANRLLYPTPDGGLVLTEPTNAGAVATLVYGVHFKKLRVIDEFKLRFSDYAVKAYDHENDKALKGSVKDGGLNFFRPMHMVADRHGTGLGACERRAQLERNRRTARAHRLEFDVVGWTHAKGLWAVNTQVRVVYPPRGIDAVFLIAERSFRRDDQWGSITSLQVMHREAFVGEAVKVSKKSAKKVRK